MTNAHDMVLVADIGGTNARFALAVREATGFAIRHKQRFQAREFDSVAQAASAYLDDLNFEPKRACFAAAGPLLDGEVRFTNSPWIVREAEIIAALRFGYVPYCE